VPFALAGFVLTNVLQKRVNGTHALSRAIGDLELKQNPVLKLADQAISNSPDFIEHPITDKETFLILACDGIVFMQIPDILVRIPNNCPLFYLGLWDVMTNQEAVSFVQEHLERETDLDIVATNIAQHALDLGSLDNVSVCIVILP